MSNEPTTNFFRVSHEIVSSKQFRKLKPASQALYLHFCRLRNRYQRKKTFFSRSLRLLMKDTGMGRKAVQAAISELDQTMFVRSHKRRGCSTRFRIFDPQEAKNHAP